jgi:6-phosphofructokinase 1
VTGNVLVGQSGGPTAVINASLAGVVRASLESGVATTLGMRFGIEGFLNGEVCDLSALSAAELQLLARTPSSALGSCRYKLQDDDLPRVLKRLREHEIRYLLYIGGNDTMDTINRIEAYCRSEGYELYGVGVPKTVDNDLYATDHTPGYPSAARYVALSVQQGGRLARDMKRVDTYTIFQTVGRDAGWLAAASALARKAPDDPPHLIYVPERPVTKEQIVTEATEVIDRIGWCSIVAGEGLRWADGTPVSASSDTDRFNNVEYGAMAGTSAAMVLHRIIADATGTRGEFQVTESLPMAAADRVPVLDREEAEACGHSAASRALAGESGVMVTIEREPGPSYRSNLGTAPLSEVAVRARPMPDDFLGKSDVTDAFLEYARPLVGPMPEYFSFDEVTP